MRALGSRNGSGSILAGLIAFGLCVFLACLSPLPGPFLEAGPDGPAAVSQEAAATQSPTQLPTEPAVQPTAWPTTQPTAWPTTQPTAWPTTRPTTQPTMQPSEAPAAPTPGTAWDAIGEDRSLERPEATRPDPEPSPSDPPAAPADGLSLLKPRRPVDPDQPMIALTFDDGPSARLTGRLLDILGRNGAAATFFVLGCQARYSPDLLRRMVEEGHEIGNHTFGHDRLSRLSDAGIRETVERTQVLVEAATGIRPVLLRSPYGIRIDRAAALVGMPMIHWCVDPRDWEDRNAGRVVRHILEKARDGSIVILHDTRASTIDAAERVIPALMERGYQLVTISELYAARGRSLVPGTAYFNAYP